jgi:hypothetical protein
MADALLETTIHPNSRFQMANAVLEITMLKTTMHSNGRCTLKNNNALKWQMNFWKQYFLFRYDTYMMPILS